MDNYFELFHLPLALPVDTSLLSTQYQQLQKQYHPDNFATAVDSDKIIIVQRSAMINDAYNTLKDPIKAAEYLLTLKGFDVAKEQNIIHDNDFLMEQFVLREKLDLIENQADELALDDFFTEITTRKKTVYNELLDLISVQKWSSALNQINKIRYLTRLIEQIEKLQDGQDHL